MSESKVQNNENENIYRRLSRIQKFENLNEVFSVGDTGPGNAYHNYMIVIPPRADAPDETEVGFPIPFQNGPRKDPKSEKGVLDTDLLEIVRDRLTQFQSGDFACIENENALRHVEEALLWLNKRVEDRIERGILGTNNK